MAIYKFTLDIDKTFVLSHRRFNKLPEGMHPIFFDGRLMGNVIIRPVKNENTVVTIAILKGYSWDGCTPKIKVGDNIVGIWDGFTSYKTKLPKCYYGSLVHDFLLQFQNKHNVDVNSAHLIMLLLFKRDKFELSCLYYLAVCLWSTLKKLFR